MINLEIDDKKLEKERRKMEKEERKLQKEQEKALRQQNRKVKAPKDANNSGTTKFQKYKDSRTAKRIITVILVVALIIGIFLGRGVVTSYVESVKNETAIKDNEVVMVNVIGYDMESAIKELEKNEIKYNIIYIIDEYNLPGNVVKTSRNPGDYVDKNTPVKIYICDNGNLDTDITHSIKTEPTPFNKDHLDVLSFYVEENVFNIVIQNNNEIVIGEIEYTIGYEDSMGTKIGDKVYKEQNLSIQPGEKYILSNTISNNDVYSLTIEKFKCSIAAVEEN